MTYRAPKRIIFWPALRDDWVQHWRSVTRETRRLAHWALAHGALHRAARYE